VIADAGRVIGPWGTTARVVLGVVLAGSVLYGHADRGWHPAAWLLGLLAFPAVALAAQWWWARRNSAPLRAAGPIAHVVNVAIFVALYLTTWYAPAVDVSSDAALLFYGASMLVAAGRGYAGCEVLAVSNWLLRRDDQIGCAVFWPIDALEARRIGRTTTATAGAGRAH
jgi:hypothetical protein